MENEAKSETTFMDNKHSINNSTDKTDKSIEDDNEIEHPSDVIGGWGPTQQRVVISIVLVYMIAPFSKNNIVYTAPSNVDFYCVDIDPMTNTSVYLKNSCTIGNYSGAPKCTKFEHDTSFHKRTLINTFDLVCDKSWYPSFAQSIYQMGFAVSGILLGVISDKYGRFFASKIAIGLEIIAGFAQAFAPTIYYFWCARFFMGIAAYGRFLNGYILISEWVGPNLRGKFSSVIYEIGGLLGSCFFLAAFYFYPDYVAIEKTVRIVEIFMLIGFMLVAKESPRWLLTHGKWTEAKELLKSAALETGKYQEDEIDRRIEALKEYTLKEQQKLEKENKEKASVFDIWKDPKLLKTSLILYFSWFSLAFIGYASGLNVGQLGISIYGISLFNKIVAVPSMCLTYWLIGRFERKTLGRSVLYVMATCIFGSLLCALHPSLVIPLVLFGRVYETSNTITFLTLYMMTAEFFPTSMRQTSMGICSLFGRIGSVVAPFIKELTIATSLWVPFAIFFGLTCVTATLWLLLPETMDIQLPDNVLQSKRVEEEEEKVRRRRRSSLA